MQGVQVHHAGQDLLLLLPLGLRPRVVAEDLVDYLLRPLGLPAHHALLGHLQLLKHTFVVRKHLVQVVEDR